MSPIGAKPLSLEPRYQLSFKDLKSRIETYVTEFSPLRSHYKKQHMRQLYFFLQLKNLFTAKKFVENLLADSQFCSAYFTVSKAKRLIEECSSLLPTIEPDLFSPNNNSHRTPVSFFKRSFSFALAPKFLNFRIQEISLWSINNDCEMRIIETKSDFNKVDIFIRGKQDCESVIKQLGYDFPGGAKQLKDELQKIIKRMPKKIDHVTSSLSMQLGATLQLSPPLTPRIPSDSDLSLAERVNRKTKEHLNNCKKLPLLKELLIKSALRARKK
jgi:hypothetical protein